MNHTNSFRKKIKIGFSFWFVSIFPLLLIIYLVVIICLLLTNNLDTNGFLFSLLPLFSTLITTFFLVTLFTSFKLAETDKYKVYDDGIESGFGEIKTRYSDIKAVKIRKMILVYVVQIHTGIESDVAFYFETSGEMNIFVNQCKLRAFIKEKNGK